MLSSIRIVLVNTTHPGNIGATARAMKNMGLSTLYLVNPLQFPHVEATARASGADDILAYARTAETLEEAIQDCGLVVATTARERGIAWPTQPLRSAANQIINEAKSHQIAVLFGQEQSGLTNVELAHCHFMMTIPANPDYSSLNLAQAVQVVCYELYCASLQATALPDTEAIAFQNELDQLASAEELQKFYQHLQQALISLNFLDEKNPRKLMHRLIRLFNRARLERREINILRGILAAVEKYSN